MNLKRCPFGKHGLKPLAQQLSVEKAWPSGLLQGREPFQTKARAATSSLTGQDTDDKNQLEGSSQPEQRLLQIPLSPALSSHLSALIGSECWHTEIMNLGPRVKFMYL